MRQCIKAAAWDTCKPYWSILEYLGSNLDTTSDWLPATASGRQLEYLDSYHPCGGRGWNSGLLVLEQPGSALAAGGIW